jgi:hypothetical protein
MHAAIEEGPRVIVGLRTREPGRERDGNGVSGVLSDGSARAAAWGRRTTMRWPGRLGAFEVFDGAQQLQLTDFSPAGLGFVVPRGRQLSQGSKLQLELRRSQVSFARVWVEVAHVVPFATGNRVGARILQVSSLTPRKGTERQNSDDDCVPIADPSLRSLVMTRLGTLGSPASLFVDGKPPIPVLLSSGSVPDSIAITPSGESVPFVDGSSVTVEATLLDALFRIHATVASTAAGWELKDPMELFSVVRRKRERAQIEPGRAWLEWRHPLDPSKRITACVRDVSPGGLSIEPPKDPGWLLPPPTKRVRFRLGEHAFPIPVSVQRWGRSQGDTIGLRLATNDVEDRMQLARAYQHARWPNLILRAAADSASVEDLMRVSGYASLRDNACPTVGWHKPPGDERLSLDLVCCNSQGVPHGHVSSLRAYENTWIYHQLATLPAARGQAAYPLYALIAEWVLTLSNGRGFAIAYFDQHKRWHRTMFADFIRWTSSEALSAIASLDRLEIVSSSTSHPPREGSFTVRFARPKDFAHAAYLARSCLPSLTADALDIHEHSMMTETLCKAHGEVGLSRGRTALVLEDRGEILGVALCETGSRQLSLFNILNMGFVFFREDPAHGADPAARAALLTAVRRFYERRGIPDPILVSPTGTAGLSEAAQTAGLASVESMGLWTTSGAGLAQWRNYIQLQLGFRATVEGASSKTTTKTAIGST